MRGPATAVIPDRVIAKPPSAELRPNQTDQDSLPPYEILDEILEKLVEDEGSVEDCVALGHDRTLVRKVESLLYGAEWKRFQAAPGTRLSRRAFWLDRRYPLANRWRDPG
jgi:NAD+ synthase